MKWLSSKEMDTANRFQILDEVVFILHSANTIENGMHPTILAQAIDKKGQTEFFNNGLVIGLGERKF